MSLIVTLLTLLFAIPALAQTPSPDPAAEQEILRLVNLERAKAGLSSLHSDPNLQNAARQHSRLMADARELSHQLDGEARYSHRLAESGATFDTSGENVAFNQTAEGAHKGLMNSPPHRKNILTPEFNSVGIGVVRVGENIWVTQDFAREFEKQNPQEARNQVIAAFVRARREAKMPPVSVVNEPRLQTHACGMAKTGELDSKSLVGVSGAISATVYTTSDLSQLPSTAMSLAKNPGVRSIGVGVCFGKTAKYESGTNWVVITAY